MTERTTGALDELVRRMEDRGDAPAVAWRERELTYAALLEEMRSWEPKLRSYGVSPGNVCAIAVGDYSPSAIALLLAIMRTGAVAVPLSRSSGPLLEPLLRIAAARTLFRSDDDETWTVERRDAQAHPLVQELTARGHPGLIVFTSGSTGKPKGILHDAELMLEKFRSARPAYRTLLFLLLDHFGGLNTLCSVLAYGGLAAIAPARTPDAVCATIERVRVELLPTTPSFLNVLLASGAFHRYDLSSVRLITYGTEVMPSTTLRRIADVFPHARLQQTYGLSELGVLRSRSKDSVSRWVRLGGEGFETKVVDGQLYVRSQFAMVGYLNAQSPIDAEGWMNTGDLVEVDGDHYRILGRASDVINVGGQKVFPQEVEAVLLEADGVVDASVYAMPNPLMGSAVVARVRVEPDEDQIALTRRLRRFCLDRLPAYKVPVRFRLGLEPTQLTSRGKKVRTSSGDPNAGRPTA